MYHIKIQVRHQINLIIVIYGSDKCVVNHSLSEDFAMLIVDVIKSVSSKNYIK